MATPSEIPWPEWVGRYHVASVHFPIALLIVGAALAALDALRPAPSRAAAARACLGLGAATAVGAALLGWLHAAHVAVGGSMKATLEAHRWSGTAAALFAVAAVAFERAAASSRFARRMRLASIALAAVAVGAAGHLGGSLAYGPDYFWPFGRGVADEGAPQPSSTQSEPLAPLAPAADPAVDFARDVLPILEDRCFECHGERKQKARLRLDRASGLYRAGDDGPIVAPGDPAASVLYQRVTLPADHDDRMPSEGEPLTPEQIEILRNWIAGGAHLDGAAAPAIVEPMVETEPAVPSAPAESGTAAEIARALEALRALGANAGPLAQDTDLVSVDFHLLGATVGDEHVERLAPLAPVLAELNLARTSITDAALDAVAQLRALDRLDLSSTAVGDGGVAKLAPLGALEVLNLHGTRVGDPGLAALAGLQALKRVYVWRTAVTDAGIASFAALRPDVRLVRGESAE